MAVANKRSFIFANLCLTLSDNTALLDRRDSQGPSSSWTLGRTVSSEVLIDGEANLEAVGEGGQTPLHLAARSKNAELVMVRCALLQTTTTASFVGSARWRRNAPTDGATCVCKRNPSWITTKRNRLRVQLFLTRLCTKTRHICRRAFLGGRVHCAGRYPSRRPTGPSCGGRTNRRRSRRRSTTKGIIPRATVASVRRGCTEVS